MKIKKITSVFLAAVMVLCSLSFAFTTANAAVSSKAASGDGDQTLTYVFKAQALPNEGDSGNIVAYEGRITFPSALEVASTGNDLLVKGYAGTGAIECKLKTATTLMFNATAGDIRTGFDFSQSEILVQVTFNVNGTYNAGDIKTDISEFYTQKQARGTDGTSLKYKASADGKTVESGTAAPGADKYYDKTPDPETTYTFEYSFRQKPKAALSTIEKTYTTVEQDLDTVVELAKPYIKSPYYSAYNVASCTLSGNKYLVTLEGVLADYYVTVKDADNGTEVKHGPYRYEQVATFNTDVDSLFIVDGKVVATGTSFSTYVLGNMTIDTEPNEGDTADEYVMLNFSANCIINNSQISGTGKDVIKLSFLTTINTDKFSKMGVAYSLSDKTNAQIEAAINADKTTGGVAIHTSSVKTPNVSGQYQFFFSPEITKSNVTTETKVYFWSYLVKTDGTIKICDNPEIADMRTILA